MKIKRFFPYLFIIFLSSNSQQEDSLTNVIKQKYNCANEGFDYIVVGVGTAGGLVAKKLSDDKQTSVIALHSGKNLTQNPLIKFSRGAAVTVLSALFGKSALYQTRQSTPQEDADNRQLLWALALPEGGASSINAGAYCRQTNDVNQKWEEIAGPNWSVNRITKLYKTLETYAGETTNPAVRGFHGPLNVRQVQHPSEVAKKFTEAIINATGFPFVLDYNDPNTPIGVSSQLQYTQSGENGELRVSSATAFLDSAVVTPDGNGVNGRKLKILFDSTALKTIWSGNKAIGVEYVVNGIKQQVFAQKGIIVCAGYKSTPFLLHSGVGPAGLLNSLNIPVIFNNDNVGEGLADQPHIILIFTSNRSDTQIPPIDPGLFTQISWLPDPNGNQSVRALRLATINTIPGITMGLFDLCQPKSRGKISINSSDPLSPPVIDFGILSNSDDLELYVRGFQTYIKNINIALQQFNGYKLIYPDPAILDDEEALREFIQAEVASNQHLQSHCRMTKKFKQGGVVNSFGKVFGVGNLYVADDSVVPLDMDGSPMASAYLMALGITNFILNKGK